ncbi:MAG: hypothetical protein GF408_06210 [Candidatus Omnitrophica bacterium]|nr:hypothetical protein [Candidatus Omnitrophota bacterium]
MQDISYYLNNPSPVTFIAVFLGGLATSFTPCVYPLIPIIVGVIGTGRDSSRARNFILSVSYVMGMAVTFSALGAAAALTGKLFGQFQTNPLVYLVVGNVMIFFALALVDVIPLPTLLLARAGAGKPGKSGHPLSVFFMGVASGFVASPCAAAVLGALLAFVATTQNPVLGVSLLFTFALGFGVVLIVIGTFAGIVSSLPRSEKAMKAVQKIFALLLILLGEYYIYKAGMLSL